MNSKSDEARHSFQCFVLIVCRSLLWSRCLGSYDNSVVDSNVSSFLILNRKVFAFIVGRTYEVLGTGMRSLVSQAVSPLPRYIETPNVAHQTSSTLSQSMLYRIFYLIRDATLSKPACWWYKLKISISVATQHTSGYLSTSWRPYHHSYRHIFTACHRDIVYSTITYQHYNDAPDELFHSFASFTKDITNSTYQGRPKIQTVDTQILPRRNKSMLKKMGIGGSQVRMNNCNADMYPSPNRQRYLSLRLRLVGGKEYSHILYYLDIVDYTQIRTYLGNRDQVGSITRPCVPYREIVNDFAGECTLNDNATFFKCPHFLIEMVSII